MIARLPEAAVPALERFDGSFTQQEGIPEAAITRAVAVMRSGRLHRYNVTSEEGSETALPEREFADYVGMPYCLAVASGGYAMQTALRALGLAPGAPVLTNAFTLSPVPGAIAAAGGRAVLVETTEALVIDLDHLAQQARASGARLLMLSHMRGHLVDMDALMALCDELGVAVIEDCAHTMGASWRGRASGTFGVAACYSTQTYKHINSGEGGLLVTRDAEVAARATVLSGSYMFYDRHEAGPPPAAYDSIRLDTPNCSGRMDDLRAAVLRPQLTSLDEKVRRWNARYAVIEAGLAGIDGLVLVQRPAEEYFVGSSIQFFTEGLDQHGIVSFIDRCAERGVSLKWFGPTEPAGYTSRHVSWRYLESQALPRTDAVLATLCDMRISLTFSEEDCALIARIIKDCYTAR